MSRVSGWYRTPRPCNSGTIVPGELHAPQRSACNAIVGAGAAIYLALVLDLDGARGGATSHRASGIDRGRGRSGSGRGLDCVSSLVPRNSKVKARRYLHNAPIDPTQTRLVIYTRPDCLLCDIAQRALNDFCQRRALRFASIDITNDALLLSRYAQQVPVICVDGEAVCVVDFDPERLEPYFD